MLKKNLVAGIWNNIIIVCLIILDLSAVFPLQIKKFSSLWRKKCLIRVDELCYIQFWTQKILSIWDRDRKGWRNKTTSKRSMLIEAIKLRKRIIMFVWQKICIHIQITYCIFERWKMQQLARFRSNSFRNYT